MKSIKIGVLEVRGDLKATKKELKERFSKWLSDAEIDELDAKLNPNEDRGTEPKAKKVRKRKSNKK